MKEMRITVLVVGAILAAVVLSNALYTVAETEQVIVTQFGKPVGRPITTPGLKLKMPFTQTVQRFEKRFMEWDGDPNQIPTKDKRFIWVDSYARWRITDPLLFFQRLRDERGAQSRLDDILDGETRNTIAKNELIDLVRSTNRPFVVAEDVAELSQPEAAEKVAHGRDKLTQEVLQNARRRTGDLGIEILDFRIKQINYVEAVRQEVYARMISERKRIAELYRSEGAGEAARIAGEKERQLRVVESEAYRQAQEIRGKADAQAADIYAAAYNRDPDFYRFLKSMNTLRESIDPDTTLILSTDSELLRYLNSAKSASHAPARYRAGASVAGPWSLVQGCDVVAAPARVRRHEHAAFFRAGALPDGLVPRSGDGRKHGRGSDLDCSEGVERRPVGLLDACRHLQGAACRGRRRGGRGSGLLLRAGTGRRDAGQRRPLDRPVPAREGERGAGQADLEQGRRDFRHDRDDRGDLLLRDAGRRHDAEAGVGPPRRHRRRAAGPRLFQDGRPEEDGRRGDAGLRRVPEDPEEGLSPRGSPHPVGRRERVGAGAALHAVVGIRREVLQHFPDGLGLGARLLRPLLGRPELPFSVRIAARSARWTSRTAAAAFLPASTPGWW